MAITFPVTIDSLGNPSSSNKLGTSTPVHSQQHSDANDAIEALEAKVGVDSSAVAGSLDYKTQAATTSRSGIVELATDAEAYTGTDTGRTITPSNLTGIGYLTGWVPMTVSLTYSSVDDPTGVITSSADYSGVLSAGMRIKFTNNAATVYGIITAISGTTITFLHEIDPSDSLATALMQNSAITNPFFSFHKAPYGFPVDPRKWTRRFYSVSDEAITTGAAWTVAVSAILSVPIGAWRLGYKVNAYLGVAGGLSWVTLSSIDNNESDRDFTATGRVTVTSSGIEFTPSIYKNIILAAKTTYKLNVKSYAGAGGGFNFYGSGSGATVIEAICAYL